MNFAQLLAVLRARWLLVLLVIGSSVAAAVAASLLLPKNYTASASVLIDFKRDDIVAGGFFPTQMAPAYMATQVDIVQSRNVATRVVRNLKLTEAQGVRQQFQEATQGRGTVEDWLADRLVRFLDVRPARDSSVIDITFSGRDPKFAAAVANAFARAYIEASLELRVQPAKQASVWFEERTRALRIELESSQSKLSQFQRSKGIVASEERLDVETARLEQLSMQLSQTEGQTFDAVGRKQQADRFIARGSPLDSLPDALVSPLIQGLKSELSRQEARLQEVSSQYGRNHPTVIAAQAEADSVRRRLAEELRGVASGLDNAYQNTARRETDLRAAVAAQKARVLELKRARDELSVLARETDSAQRAFDTTKQRYSQTSLEGLASQTNVAILNTAVEPTEHASPRLWLNLVLGVVLGSILALASAFAVEAIDPRVRRGSDLAEAIDVPLLGDLPRGHSRLAWARA